MDKAQDKDPFKLSELVLYMARYWLYMALGAIVLYLILVTIENHKTTIVVSRTYRVPIERDETKEWEEAEETKHYHNIKGDADGDG